jgi:hypothetical protein
MGDSTDDSDILIEDSRNLNDGASEEKGDIRDKSEMASQRTLGQQGVFVKTTAPITETVEPPEDFYKRLLDQGGIEIIPNKEGEVSDL